MSRLPLAGFLLLPVAAVAADTYQVGVSQVDITPSHPIRLNGFGGRRAESEGVYQRIWAKALAIDDDTRQPALLMTVDVLGIPEDIRAELARRFAKRVGLKPERLAITATHTHTGPMLKGANVTLFGTPIPKDHLANIDKYTTEFLDKLERVGLEALEWRKPAKLSYAIGRVGFAVNRRTRGGPVDHDLPTLFIQDTDGRVRAVYTSYACHCVTLSHNQVGGDWAGFAAEEIQSAFPDSIALVSVGCGADANPSSGVTGDKVETARLQGREIATEVKRLSTTFRAPVIGKLTAQSKSIQLPLAPLPTREQWEEKAKRTDAIGHHARYQLEKLDRAEALLTKIDYLISTWAFGDSMAMAFLPGEVVVDYSLRLKKELDGQRLWVTAYANQAPCYIPSERVLKEGGYEGGGAMIYYDIPVPFKPGLEEPIVATVKEQLGKTIPAKFDASRTGGSMPQTPQQSLAAIKTKANLAVELVAAEPLLDSPVAIDFGPDGRLWVCEMVDYPEGKAGKYEPGGRIRVLESTKGDGRFDKATVFLDKIPFPTGVTVWKKGVLVCAAPDILYAEDTDGDGKADVVKKLFSGFGTTNYQARVNSLQYGLDGWVYGACGLFGGQITSFNGKTYALGNRDFRIKPDTGELEPVTGLTQQGRVRDDWGNWFGCDNSTLIRHYPLDDHYLKRNPHVAYPDPAARVPAEPIPNRLYPLRSDAQRFQLSGPPNAVTAACGLGIYRDNLLGDDFRGNAFTCEPVNLCVHRLKLTPRGSTFAGYRPDDEKTSEFLASTDSWFRPVQAVTGPDGCLWIVDMYRFVIEHPRWIPPADVARLDLRAGAGMGRIYRLRPKDKEPRKWDRMDKADSVDLLTKLHSPNGWQRDMATEMLVSKGDQSVARGLVTRANYAADPVTRLHALSALDRLGELSPKVAMKALNDPDPGVRRWAVQYSEKLLDKNTEVGTAIAALKTDADAQVRLQVAYSLGAWDDASVAGVTLSRMALKNADDPYLIAAVLSSLTKKNLASAVLPIRRESGPNGPPVGLMTQLVRTAAALDNRDVLWALADAATEEKVKPWKAAVIGEFFERQEPSVVLMRKSERFYRSVVLMKAHASVTLADASATDADRLAVLPLIGRGDMLLDAESSVLRGLVSNSTSPTLRSAVVAHVGRLTDPKAASLLVDGWKGHPPTTRTQILDVLLARKDGPAELLAAVEAKTISPGEIDAAHRQRLLTSSDKSVRDRAAKLFDGAVNADRARVIQEYADLPAGDKDRGKAVFTRVCAACHKLGDVGVQVGPDLAALANRTPAYLLQEILDPNRNLDSRYVEYQAVTKGERTVTGILAAETATTILLRGQQGKEETLLRTDIEELRAAGKSLMPEGIEKDVSKKDMADLLAFLTAMRPPPKAFAGNTPALIKAEDRRMTLRATQAEIYGGEIAFETEFKNIGMWHGVDDRAEWRIEVPVTNTYDIFIDFACDAGSAGNELLIEGANPTVRWKVPSTGTWAKYQTVRVGIVKLTAGDGRIVVRPAGPLHSALIDLRTVYILPPGKTPSADSTPQDPTDVTELAKLILDDSQSQDRRNRLIANNAHQSAALIQAMAADIPDDKEEYRRIPWIWRVAIAAGKRNDAKELKSILAVALPKEKEQLRHWQAVVIGGGVINGISQAGAWPGRRLTEVLNEDVSLKPRWKAALNQSFAMADDAKVPTGTRYDALRMVALADWEGTGTTLTRYLKKDSHAELQMGAVSGLGDIESPRVASLLIKSMPDLTEGNRKLAIAALARTPERANILLNAVESGTVKVDWVDEAGRKALLGHADAEVRARAERLLKK